MGEPNLEITPENAQAVQHAMKFVESLRRKGYDVLTGDGSANLDKLGSDPFHNAMASYALTTGCDMLQLHDGLELIRAFQQL